MYIAVMVACKQVAKFKGCIMQRSALQLVHVTHKLGVFDAAQPRYYRFNAATQNKCDMFASNLRCYHFLYLAVLMFRVL